MNMALRNGNGSKPHSSPVWKRQTVQQFFTAFNWDNYPPVVQELKRTALQSGSEQSLSLTLKVREFLGAVNWDGGAIATVSDSSKGIIIDNSATDFLTLDNFSDLF
ncbi:hypothetical protein IFO70_01785 [Phormidium tenue FACHB-886]|nr:hypothetical protein [Phormidium tenue FACHB-886]